MLSPASPSLLVKNHDLAVSGITLMIDRSKEFQRKQTLDIPGLQERIAGKQQQLPSATTCPKRLTPVNSTPKVAMLIQSLQELGDISSLTSCCSYMVLSASFLGTPHEDTIGC
ncbi:predicted protein [Botrytis cinerea T4]|uniref:Uncharacterized protein n=1 Tax=Botryotinia fuckeliana (strain T4) TaxID=999810 RepID=G2YHQ6_BOTF4|nr:predicted protein [Botrytis cinerea T4]